MFQRDELGFLIKLIHDDIGVYCRHYLQTSQLTRTQSDLLDWLHVRMQENKSTSIRDVVDYFGIRQPTASGIVKRMEERGLLVRIPDPKDKRACLIEPAMHTEHACADTSDLESILFEGFDERERKELIRMLQAVHTNLENKLNK